MDDEKLSGELLATKIKKSSTDISIGGIFHLPQQGLDAINEQQPDVVFLDIEMPGLDGLTLAKSIESNKTEVIFTTAYNAYAIEAVRIKALDYLLKPISIPDLQMALLRLKEKIVEREKIKTAQSLESLVHKMQMLNAQYNKIALSTLEGILFVPVKEIVRIESDSNYSTLFLLSGKKIVVSKTLRIMEEMLLPYSFMRPHKSHLINLEYVSKYLKGDGGTIIMMDGSQIEVSRQRKDNFLKIFSDR